MVRFHRKSLLCLTIWIFIRFLGFDSQPLLWFEFLRLIHNLYFYSHSWLSFAIFALIHHLYFSLRSLVWFRLFLSIRDVCFQWEPFPLVPTSTVDRIMDFHWLTLLSSAIVGLIHNIVLIHSLCFRFRSMLSVPVCASASNTYSHSRTLSSVTIFRCFGKESQLCPDMWTSTASEVDLVRGVRLEVVGAGRLPIGSWERSEKKHGEVAKGGTRKMRGLELSEIDFGGPKTNESETNIYCTFFELEIGKGRATLAKTLTPLCGSSCLPWLLSLIHSLSTALLFHLRSPDNEKFSVLQGVETLAGLNSCRGVEVGTIVKGTSSGPMWPFLPPV
jgi:hypothetical protein